MTRKKKHEYVRGGGGPFPSPGYTGRGNQQGRGRGSGSTGSNNTSGNNGTTPTEILPRPQPNPPLVETVEEESTAGPLPDGNQLQPPTPNDEIGYRLDRYVSHESSVTPVKETCASSHSLE